MPVMIAVGQSGAGTYPSFLLQYGRIKRRKASRKRFAADLFDARGWRCVPGQPNWKFGSNHTAQQWQERMTQRGWTPDQITEAIQSGQRFAAANNVNPANAATRYVHPTTGRSVVVDDVTMEVIHVGADGFLY